jgi:glycosyltransferase involved in cell wall biosynthesis
MKIVYLCTDPGIPLYGRKGCSTHVRETVHALMRLGHEVKILCSNLEGDPGDAFDVAPIQPYQSRKLGFDLRHVLLDRRARTLLEETVLEWQPDAIYERYSLYCRAGEAVALKHDLPRLVEVNAFLTREQSERIRFPWLARRVESRIIARAPHVIVVSKPLAEEVMAMGVRAENVSRMPMAVNLGLFNPEIDGSEVRRRYNLDGSFVIGYVGTLAGWHGIRLLYALANELRRRQAPPFAFLIVGGEGDKLENHRQKTREAGLEGILHFIGSVVHDQVPRHIRAFDAAIVPDTTYWSSPAKLFEYQACALPVLAPSYPAILSAMTDGGEGFIYPPEDVSAMADAVMKLMVDPEMRRQMGRAARTRAAAEHSWQANAEAIVRLFERAR